MRPSEQLQTLHDQLCAEFAAGTLTGESFSIALKRLEAIAADVRMAEDGEAEAAPASVAVGGNVVAFPRRSRPCIGILGGPGKGGAA